MAKIDKKEAISSNDTSKSSISNPNNDTKISNINELSSVEKKAEKTNKRKHSGLLAFCLIFGLLTTISASLYFDLEMTKKIQADFNTKLLNDYSNEFAKLNKRIDNQQNEINALQNMPAPELSDVQLENIIKTIKFQLKNSENSLTDATSANSSTSSTEKISAEVLLASGAIVVRGLADSGQTFIYETEILQVLAQNNEPAKKYVATIQQYANLGIKGKAMLISEFNKIYATLSMPKKEKVVSNNVEESWQSRFINGLKSLVVLQKSTPKKMSFPKQPDEVWQLVNVGNFAEALNLINTDKKYREADSAELSAWTTQVINHLDFERAVNGLILNSLANLRLKEITLSANK